MKHSREHPCQYTRNEVFYKEISSFFVKDLNQWDKVSIKAKIGLMMTLLMAPNRRS